ncbi:glycoside hydrolase family 44 protein [Microbispora sp. NPDC049125]|uniref:glycoside hydrolase family 44 protein n=1 Tax=Microbispora sp. NPDC049125 TaxID=3154929 RepID=UPI00346770CB
MRTRLLPLALTASLIAGTGAVMAAPTPALAADGPQLTVDSTAGRHPISPYIYGMNFADEALAEELALPVRRWGGNATTRYNYLYDTSNRASDWFFENIAETNDDPSQLPDGSTVDKFVEQDRRTDTQTVLTVPLIGWVPKGRDASCGFSVAKYGPQQQTDQWRPDCGNGIRTDGTRITGNDPHDTSVEAGPEYVRDWLGHLTGKFGTAAKGGVRFYDLDNEPDIWHGTHRDVHPEGASSVELRDRGYLIGAAIKEADPGAKTLGPVGWGWSSWDYSGLDQETCGRTNCWSDPPDKAVRGGLPFAAWYLRQMKAYQDQHDLRVLDYFDMHFYPQASGVAFGRGGDPATDALRLRSTRALWDPTYTDESWINTPVRLVPRMKDLVAAEYPGTGTAITEYNWGALDHINGALTQADILGIFGREGLDLATLWSPPSASQPGAYAFRMYLNYDGDGGRFGDVAVSGVSADQGKLSVYGAERSADGALTVMVVNKSGTELTSPVTIKGRSGGAAEVYRYGAASLSEIVHAPGQPITRTGSDGTFTHTFPADSITLFVIPEAAADTTPPTAPGTPVASAITNRSATLTWLPSTDDTGVTAYEVWAQAGGDPSKVATVTGTTATISSLSPATRYAFTVRAADAAGNVSPPSPAVTVTTLPDPNPLQLAARHRNLDTSATDNAIKPGLQVANTGARPVALSRVTLRYWFTRDGGPSTVNVWCDWAKAGCGAVTRRVVPLATARPKADAYLEVGFTAAAGSLNPGQTTGDIQLRMSKADWSAFEETGDHSWAAPAPAYADNPRVTVYIDGARVAGTEP